MNRIFFARHPNLGKLRVPKRREADQVCVSSPPSFQSATSFWPPSESVLKPAAWLLLGAQFLILSAAAQPAAGAEGFAWQEKADSTALVRGEQIIWRFNHGPSDTKPCFHPVAAPGGPVLTGFRPEDHPWHRALWFSWKFIDGVNYWEEDKKTGQSEGRTEYRNLRIERRPDYSARLALDLEYRPANAVTVLSEERVIEVSAPDREGGYHLDWSLRFVARTNLLLDRTPLPEEPKGQPYGGYAGLSVRFAPEMKAVQAITALGPVEFKDTRFRGQASGLEYSGEFAGRTTGIAMLDHPQNLNSPSPWYAINDRVMNYFSPAVLCYQPHSLKTGGRLNLRYRVWIHPGRWNAARLEAETRRFARE